MGDTGRIVANKNVFQVTDCKKSPTGHSVHIGRMSGGFLTVGDRVTASVDADRRRAIMRNHTACHLLQAALRKVLGDHVHQAGSYVDDKRCRFDFSHFSAVTPEELKQVEKSVNRAILSALPVTVKSMPIEEARKLGAMALFGEKYGDIVRVCDVTDFSREFCGGTHVDNTSKIGLFKILSESSVAAGVRRIEATTGLGVLELLEESQQTVAKAAETLKVANHTELVSRCAAVMAELKEKERALAALEQKMADSRIQGLFENAQAIGKVRFISAAFSGTKPETLRMMGDKIREQAPNVVAVLLSVNEGKATLLAVCGKDAIASGMHAGKILKEAVSSVGGSGGGRPESAMGGVPDPLRADEAVEKVPEILERMVK